MTTEIHGVLKNVSYSDHAGGRVAHGNLYGDTKGRFRDGEYVRTSFILDGPGDDGVIRTRNSVYRVEECGGVEEAADLDMRQQISALTTLLDSLNAPTVEDDMALSLAGRVAALVARMKTSAALSTLAAQDGELLP